MTISSRKISAYTKTHQMLPPVPSPAYSATQLQQWYDTAPEEARVAINGLIDDLLSSVTGSSGARSIGVETISGVTGNDLFAVLTNLKAQINASAAGAIPDGTITPQKLSFDPGITIKDATGTATAITINAPGYLYSDNGVLTFIASANNAGAATTINVNSNGARQLYKPGTTAAPTLIAGKAYTVWYDASSSNFFIKASAEGTAVAGHVLAGQTFSNDIDVGIPGTMINNSGATLVKPGASITAARVHPTWPNGGQLEFTVPQGFSDGNTKIVLDVSGLRPEYVKKDVVIGNDSGTPGTFMNGTLRIIEPGDGIIASADTTRGTTSLTYVKVKSITINLPGTHRISFDLTGAGSGISSFGRVYKNGVAIGIERVNNVNGSTVVYTEDFSFVPGDTVELWTHTSDGLSGSKCANFRVKMNTPTVTLD